MWNIPLETELINGHFSNSNKLMQDVPELKYLCLI
jgi:hypothetical protein